jgi:hypothetical protein
MSAQQTNHMSPLSILDLPVGDDHIQMRHAFYTPYAKTEMHSQNRCYQEQLLCKRANNQCWPLNPHPTVVVTFALTTSHQIKLILRITLCLIYFLKKEHVVETDHPPPLIYQDINPWASS